MKKISQILNSSKVAVAQMKLIYKIWYSSVIDDIKNVTTPYDFDPLKKILTINVHDNIWYSEMLYMEQEFMELLHNNGFDVNKIIFKLLPKYEKLDKKNIINYNISKRAESYINNYAQRFDNKVLGEYFKEFLTNFFHQNNFDNWILKG